jgi:hypothetical protein
MIQLYDNNIKPDISWYNYMITIFKWVYGTVEIVQSNLWYNGTCLIQHIKGAGICVGLHMMLENSGFILVNRYTYGP